MIAHTTNSLITITVRGVYVSGIVVERSPADTELELLDPYGDMPLRHSSHIMAAARPYLSFDGEHGDRRVDELLREVYEAALYAFENKDQLRTRWLGLSEAVAARCSSRVRSESELARLRAESRKLLRSGAISADDHERALRDAADELDEWGIAVEEAVDELYKNSPVSPAYSLRQQLMVLVDPAFPQGGVE